MTRDPFLQTAIDEARLGLDEGGIPIGSVLVHKGRILGRGHNLRVQLGDPLLHGEMSAFKHAGRQPAHVHRECVLYTNLSPYPMCSGTALLYKFPRIVIAANIHGPPDPARGRGLGDDGRGPEGYANSETIALSATMSIGHRSALSGTLSRIGVNRLYPCFRTIRNIGKPSIAFYCPNRAETRIQLDIKLNNKFGASVLGQPIQSKYSDSTTLR